MTFDRVEKGLAIAKHGGVQRAINRVVQYVVTDFAGSQRQHTVTHNLDTDEWDCTCEDFKYNGIGHCKHIWAVKIDEDGE